MAPGWFTARRLAASIRACHDEYARWLWAKM
jgi:hypothetical protein